MKLRFAIILAFVLMLAACAPAPTATPTEAEPTATELPTEIPPTSTPEPTATPDVAATEAAAAAAAEAEALAEIEEDLEDIGLSANDGDLVYLQSEPVELVINEQAFNGVIEDHGDETSYGNFIMGVDITWETKTGLSGCGLIFRAEEDLDAGQQLQFITMRLSGAPQWGVGLYRYGGFQGNLGADFNSGIRAGQGDKNNYIFVADGLSVTMYANGIRLGLVTLPAARTEGRFGLIGWQDSGQTTCTFENMWVLALPEE